MNRIWAPWRIKYVKKIKSRGCVLCRAARNKQSDKKYFVVFRGRYCFSVLNIYPYNNGHFMACPLRHVKDLSQLRKEEVLDLFLVIQKTRQLTDKALKPHGYNMGLNLGKASGAGIANHIHMHVVPRWSGDTNFMPLIADTKILPQSLEDLYEKLTHAHARRHRKKRG